MIHSRRWSAVLAFCAVAASSPAWGVDPPPPPAPFLWDQSDVDVAGGFNVSAIVSADDFVVTQQARLTGGTVWISDVASNDNGTLDNFSGALSWGIYTDAGGVPGTAVATGPAIHLVQTDTGFQSNAGLYDLFRIEFDFPHPVSLAAGTYWLLLHEGAWGSSDDGSTIWWEQAASVRGAATRYSVNLASPGSWSTIWTTDAAFVLRGDRVIWDQSPIGTININGVVLTDWITANDLVLPAAASFSSVEACLIDGVINDNGLIDNFSGTMGWGIYSDAPGKPGTLVESGTGLVLEVVDTGLQSPGGSSDIARLRMALGRTVTLGAGSWWLALREGAWGATGDGTGVYWCDTILPGGDGHVWLDPSPASPTSWDFSFVRESAFVLSEQLLFASGFEAGGTCAWTNGSSIDCL